MFYHIEMLWYSLGEKVAEFGDWFKLKFVQFMRKRKPRDNKWKLYEWWLKGHKF